MVRGCVFGVILVMAAFGSPAQSQAAEACDKIQNSFQYNECLARSAPPRAQRARRGGGDPEASVPARRRGPGATAQAEVLPGMTINRRSGRRVSATIDPWAGARAPVRKRRR